MEIENHESLHHLNEKVYGLSMDRDELYHATLILKKRTEGVVLRRQGSIACR